MHHIKININYFVTVDISELVRCIDLKNNATGFIKQKLLKG